MAAVDAEVALLAAVVEALLALALLVVEAFAVVVVAVAAFSFVVAVAVAAASFVAPFACVFCYLPFHTFPLVVVVVVAAVSCEVAYHTSLVEEDMMGAYSEIVAVAVVMVLAVDKEQDATAFAVAELAFVAQVMVGNC